LCPRFLKQKILPWWGSCLRSSTPSRIASNNSKTKSSVSRGSRPGRSSRLVPWNVPPGRLVSRVRSGPAPPSGPRPPNWSSPTKSSSRWPTCHPDRPSKGYEDFVVQDLEIRPRVTRYRRERWRSPDGRNLVAPLPEGVRPESHFGSTLISFIIYQYHYQHVTQPLLLEQLDQLGIDISAGQLNGILTEKKDIFHDEKTEVLLAGLEVSSY